MASHRDTLSPVRIPSGDGRHPNLSHARHLKWLNQLVKEWDGGPVDVGIVGIPYDGHSRVLFDGGALGPKIVRDVLYTQYSTYNIDCDTDISNLTMADCGNVAIQDSSNKLASYSTIERAVTALFNASQALIMIGGDADATMPIAKSLIQPESAKRRIGIIDFDSHYDNRDLDDEYKRGGSDWVRWLMENEAIPVKGNNIVQIGVHGFIYSAFDARYAEKSGNTVFKPKDVRRLGMQEVARQALSKVTDGTDAFYVHFCIDTFDQTFIVGTEFGSFVGGLMPWEVMDSLVEFGKHPLCRGLFICTFNPLFDSNKMLMKVICEMIMQFTTGVALRKAG